MEKFVIVALAFIAVTAAYPGYGGDSHGYDHKDSGFGGQAGVGHGTGFDVGGHGVSGHIGVNSGGHGVSGHSSGHGVDAQSGKHGVGGHGVGVGVESGVHAGVGGHGTTGQGATGQGATGQGATGQGATGQSATGHSGVHGGNHESVFSLGVGGGLGPFYEPGDFYSGSLKQRPIGHFY